MDAMQGELPEHVCSKDPIKEALAAWDVSRTDALVAQFERLVLEKEQAKKAEAAAALNTLASKCEAAKEAYANDQKKLKCAHQELEKRIHEYDTCVGEGKTEELCKVALGMIKQAEQTLDAAKKQAAASSAEYQDAKYQLREQQAENEEDSDENLVGIMVDLKDLDDVLVKDVGNKVADSGKWPLLIDVSQQASVFVRYMDTNYVNALSSKDMEPNRLRRSVLGAIRYGKPCVLDFMDVDLLDEVVRGFDVVQPWLFKSIMDKSILKNDNYLSLIRKDDGEEYHHTKFQDARAAKFKFILLTSVREPKESLVEQTYPLRIKVQK